MKRYGSPPGVIVWVALAWAIFIGALVIAATAFAGPVREPMVGDDPGTSGCVVGTFWSDGPYVYLCVPPGYPLRIY